MRWKSENLEVCYCGLFQCKRPAIAWRNLIKLRDISGKIRRDHLSNTSLGLPHILHARSNKDILQKLENIIANIRGPELIRVFALYK
jgi:hypothetical protein